MNNMCMLIISYVVSFLIFYWCYIKLNVKKAVEGNKKKQIICFGLLFIAAIAGVSLIDSFPSVVKYHYLYLGILLGPVIAFIPFVVSNNKK